MRSKKQIKQFVLIAFVLLLLVPCLAGVVFILRYQALTQDEVEITPNPTYADVTYCTRDGVSLLLDLYLPTNELPAPHRLLIYIHGGSFTSGDKRKGSGVIDIPAMTARGFAVAAVNYRLMPQYPYPSGIQDVKCAVRYLRANAEAYQLRVDKIGIWGGSAGGYYAAMTGLTIADSSFDTGEYLDQSSKVDAVVDMFGPSDLTAETSWLQKWLLRRAFETDSTDSPLLKKASPVNMRAEDAPPFLILHGDQDSAVPPQQAQALYQHLLEARVDATVVMVKNANHNFKPTGGVISPTRLEISALMSDFFDKWLQ